MNDISVLVGGEAGDGIKRLANLIARLFNRLGYHIFVYEDYPSLIKGGHNFAIIRASDKPISAIRDNFDILIALNQETIDIHKSNLKKEGIIIFDSDCSDAEGIGISLTKITNENSFPSIMRNIISFGVLAKILDQELNIVSDCIKAALPKRADDNIKLAKQGFDIVKNNFLSLDKLNNSPVPLLSGNEAIALGAVKAGLKGYFSYPMTPATSIHHVLASKKKDFGISVVHPENEISVAMMAQGFAFAGKPSMVGTSGGGFALMTESISFSGMAEIPVVFVLSQRPGPATGVPTYSGQSDLLFAINAGHGDFPKIVLAPADVDQAFEFSAFALELAWKFHVPVILLSDKNLSESTYSFTFDDSKINQIIIKTETYENPEDYKRYSLKKDGISPLSFPGDKGVVKVNSYEHDEFGITIEDSKIINKMVEKRLNKKEAVKNFLKDKETFIEENIGSDTVLVSWGSTAGCVKEVAEKLNFGFFQPIFFEPFPKQQIIDKLKNKKIICVEQNSEGQLVKLLENIGLIINKKILKYDGRPFSVDELKRRLS